MRTVWKSLAGRDRLVPLSTIYDALLTVVYPASCQICHKSVESRHYGVVCGDCWRKTKVFDGCETLCTKCGAFLNANTSNFETLCHRCDQDFYDRAVAVGLYEKALLFSILKLKRHPYIPEKLKDLLGKAFQRSGFQNTTLIIPIPLSSKRLAERGFNQARLLAEVIAEDNALPIGDDILIRPRHVFKHRAGMDRQARFESVEDAFEIANPQLVKGETVLLVDDVFTSGATASGCAKILKANGARSVFVLTVARAF